MHRTDYDSALLRLYLGALQNRLHNGSDPLELTLVKFSLADSSFGSTEGRNPVTETTKKMLLDRFVSSHSEPMQSQLRVKEADSSDHFERFVRSFPGAEGFVIERNVKASQVLGRKPSESIKPV